MDQRIVDALKDLDDTVLDDLVHETYASMAANVNNEGFERQVEVLLANGETVESILEYIEDRADDFTAEVTG